MLLTQRILVLVEIKESLGDRGCGGLILGIVVRLQIRVAQSVLDGNALGRVEGQQFFEQVQGQLVALGEECSEGNLLLKGEGPDVLACPSGFDAVVVFHRWRAENVQDQGQLVVVWDS